jgi:hypothetical protein
MTVRILTVPVRDLVQAAQDAAILSAEKYAKKVALEIAPEGHGETYRRVFQNTFDNVIGFEFEAAMAFAMADEGPLARLRRH